MFHKCGANRRLYGYYLPILKLLPPKKINYGSLNEFGCHQRIGPLLIVRRFATLWLLDKVKFCLNPLSRTFSVYSLLIQSVPNESPRLLLV